MVGYQVLIFVISKFNKQSNNKALNNKNFSNKKVSLIISAYNEEKFIEEKLKNSLESHYPTELLEIIIVSDGSTDETDKIVNNFIQKITTPKIKLLRIEGRKGKTFCQNEAVKIATGEILIFSDANSMYEKSAITEIVANFENEMVGVVCGELKYIDKNSTNKIVGESTYWNFEILLKKWESDALSCLGANGSIYGIRKNDYQFLPQHAQSDFIEPFFVYRNTKEKYGKPKRIIYDNSAICIEPPIEKKDEFGRKVRIMLGALESIHLIKDFLNPFKYGFYSIMLWSHKIFRWFSFIFLISIFVTNYLLISNKFFFIIFCLQILFYTLAFLGKFIKIKIFEIPYYFSLLQIAGLIGFISFLKGKTAYSWEKDGFVR